MELSNINTTSLKNSISSMKSSLRTNGLDEIINGISNNAWNSESKIHFRDALNRLKTNNYDKINGIISKHEAIVRLIERYQYLEKENSEYHARISILNGQLYYEEEYTYTSYTKNISKKETGYRTVKDYATEREIYRLHNLINHNNAELQRIESNVRNYL